MIGFNLKKEVGLDKGEGSVFLSLTAVFCDLYLSLSKKVTIMDVKKRCKTSRQIKYLIN